MYKKKSANRTIKKSMSYAQFIERFSNENECEEYLFKSKWPNGFVCPKCGHQHYYTLGRSRKYQCAKCRYQTSLTANTVMHRTRLPLTKWFWAIYLVACDKRGISALTLSCRISVSYETAWYLLCRIRKAMEKRDAIYTLGGIIEFDDSYFGAKIKGVRGRKAGNQGVFIALEKDQEEHPRYLKMIVTPDIQIPSVQKFVDENIAVGSTVETDGFRSYRKPLADNYTHQAEDFDPNSEHLRWLHRIVGNAKAFINGTYHGVSTEHLQMYLSEFCYRFNRRNLGGDIFDRLLFAIAR